MNFFLYDKTFEGLLSSVFYSYEMKIIPAKIISDKGYQDDFFANKYKIVSEPDKADRVWDGIKKKASKQACQLIYKVFLSELPEVEMLIYTYIKYVFETPYNVETNYSEDCVLLMNDIHKKVIKEAQRVLMFVRFQKTADDIYYASFDPQYNVVPLTVNHFKDRFSDQKWVIYDVKRNYGFFYDLNKLSEIKITESNIAFSSGKLDENILNQEEKFFKELWRSYYDSINIKERKNLKVHVQFLPKRYWKYLPEKNIW